MAFKFKAKYGNYIGGKFVDPVDGKYFDNITPVNGKVLCQIPRSNEKDINLALDAAHAAKDAWGATSVTERSQILHNIAQVMEDYLATLAEAETWDNGKPIRETTNADLPLAVDHFRYFGSVILLEPLYHLVIHLKDRRKVTKRPNKFTEESFAKRLKITFSLDVLNFTNFLDSRLNGCFVVLV